MYTFPVASLKDYKHLEGGTETSIFVPDYRVFKPTWNVDTSPPQTLGGNGDLFKDLSWMQDGDKCT